MSEAKFIAVARTGEIEPGGVKLVEARGRSILLCLHQERIFAIENLCSHAQEPLACGRVKAGWISCPAHGSRFDLATGEPLNPPATESIATFEVRISGDTVEIAL
jgi:3-phenylpropionate/trans-cinnamate dioxygenase ferredoxin subunit